MRIKLTSKVATTLLCLSLFIDSPMSAEYSEEEIRYTLLELSSSAREDSDDNMPLVDVEQMLIGPPPTDLVILNQNIRLDFPDNIEAKVGSAIDCEGFVRKCFVLYGSFKLAVGNDFSFEKQSKWQWQDYAYTATVKRELSIMGRPIEAVEVFGKSIGDNPFFITFFISPEIGVFYLKLDTGGAVYTYILDSEKGLWAKN
ncbi:MAG: Uncharacterised protein [Pseudidiomarina mangrovi]|nr:MAG: Uncharacterised protein [Pseudidiomarina mangrovi]